MNQSEIVAVTAMQASTDQSNPAVQATVVTAGGARGTGSAFESPSTSDYRPRYLYDNTASYRGRGVATAVGIIQEVVGPALLGLPADRQGLVDEAIKRALAGAGLPGYVNLSAPVSVAALGAGAASLGIPLYRHIGGQAAFTLPVGGQIAASGSKRYGADGRALGKPVYNLVAHGFDRFEEAHYGLWEAANAYEKLLAKRSGILTHRGFSMAVPAGKIESDRQLWEIMAESIRESGYDGRIGIHIDVGANDYFDPQAGLYRGLFDGRDKDREAMLALYRELVDTYPVCILQDPLEQHDMDGFALLVEETGVQIVGKDLFGTDPARIRECVDTGCVNAVLLPVCGFETFSDAVRTARYAKNRGVDVMPQALCGEGLDLADYAVGFRAGTVYQCGIDAGSNRLIAREQQIGPRARFYGTNGLRGARFGLRHSEGG